ncbi:hypothetical protein ACP70R_003881 [Stipagrostis hirtigluma subsp. patula]
MPHVSRAPAGGHRPPRRWETSRALEYALQVVFATCYWSLILAGNGGEGRGCVSVRGAFLDAMAVVTHGAMALVVREIFQVFRETRRGGVV